MPTNNISMFSSANASTLTEEQVQKALAELYKLLDSVNKLVAIRKNPQSEIAQLVLNICIKVLVSVLSREIAPAAISNNNDTIEHSSPSISVR